MGDVLTTARQEAVNGLRGGGQIAPALLAQRAENALKRLYLDSNMLSIPVYIDQEEDEREGDQDAHGCLRRSGTATAAVPRCDNTARRT